MSGVRSSWETLEVKSARSRASSCSRRSCRRATAASPAVTASNPRSSGSRDPGRATTSRPATAGGSAARKTGEPGPAVTVSPAYAASAAGPKRKSGAPSGRAHLERRERRVGESAGHRARQQRVLLEHRGDHRAERRAQVTTPYAASGASCPAKPL